MKILSIKQPYASQIMSGEKRIENRSWHTNIRGTIGIHASGPGGAILGTVELVEVLPADLALAKYPEQIDHIGTELCWVLRNPQPFKEKYPEDMKKIEAFFPLIRAYLARMKWREEACQ